MPHALTALPLRDTRKTARDLQTISADTCVVGAGITGVSAAITAARLGRDVVLVDTLPVVGGQCINSLIGLFCGVFGNAPDHQQLTHGIFDDIFGDLDGTGALHFRRTHTTTVLYDEVVLGRWMERTLRAVGVRLVLNAVLNRVTVDDGYLREVVLGTRFGELSVAAHGFVDASGDAALAWESGLTCREPERPVYGSQQVLLEGVDEAHEPPPGELASRVREKAGEYGLIRKDGLAFFFPGRGTAVMNMTHIEAPLDPVRASEIGLDGRAQADDVVEFLRREFPAAFGRARVRTYGFPGRRQTRWLASVAPLTLADVRAGIRFDDAVARTAWPIELHDHPDGYVWETFDADHLHYVPFSAMVSPEAHNLVAGGRCVDGDAAALSSVRVMGPCAATGQAAANALDLAGKGSVHEIDTVALVDRVRENVG